MLDIGFTELIVVAILALVVVGPKELPRLLRTVGGIVRKTRELAAEFKDGVEQLASEAETQADPFADLRKEEGLRPGMSPEDITDHIMKNREREAGEKKERTDGQPDTASDKADPKGDGEGRKA